MMVVMVVVAILGCSTPWHPIASHSTLQHPTALCAPPEPLPPFTAVPVALGGFGGFGPLCLFLHQPKRPSCALHTPKPPQELLLGMGGKAPIGLH